MPYQNRVLPDGSIVAIADRGQMMGNRGGRIHDLATRKLHPTRRWTSRRWIICVTSFRDRFRQVMGEGYTHLFFLDEVTALAAGHRPCFECRRADATAFATACQSALGLNSPPDADTMDRELHEDRTSERNTLNDWRGLPDGVMVRLNDGRFAALHDGSLLEWTPAGYRSLAEAGQVTAVQRLTPRLTIAALEAGFRPIWHDG